MVCVFCIRKVKGWNWIHSSFPSVWNAMIQIHFLGLQPSLLKGPQEKQPSWGGCRVECPDQAPSDRGISSSLPGRQAAACSSRGVARRPQGERLWGLSCGSSRSTHTARLGEHSRTFSRDLLRPPSVHPKSTQSLLFFRPLCPFLLLSILPLPLTNFSSPILGGVGKSTCPVWAGPGGPHSKASTCLVTPFSHPQMTASFLVSRQIHRCLTSQ